MGMSGSPPEIKRLVEMGLNPISEMPSFVRMMWYRGFLSAKQAITWREWSRPDPIELRMNEAIPVGKELVSSE